MSSPQSALAMLIRVAVRFAMRTGVPVADFYEWVKEAYVQEAAAEIKLVGREPKPSHITIITGLYRRDVKRILEQPPTPNAPPPQSLPARIVCRWEQQRRYLDRSGSPRKLTAGTDDSEFAALVREVNSDIHPGSMLLELERMGLVKRDGSEVSLVGGAALHSETLEPGYQYFAKNLQFLIASTQQNLEAGQSINHNLRTEFDNVLAEDLPHLRRWVADQGALFHKKLRAYISKYDCDLNPARARKAKLQARGRISLSSFSFSLAEQGEQIIANSDSFEPKKVTHSSKARKQGLRKLRIES